MSRSRIMSLLLIFTSTSMILGFLGPSWIFCSGIGECYSCYHGSCNPNVEVQERMWYADIYNFLYGCDVYYPAPAAYNNYIKPVSNQSAYNGTANYWMNEGDRLYLAGSYDQAASSYAEAVKLNSSLLLGWLNLGNALYFSGRYQESLDAYNTVLMRDPQNANALRGKSQTLFSLNCTAEANAALDEAKALQTPKFLELGSPSGPTIKSVVVGAYSS